MNVNQGTATANSRTARVRTLGRLAALVLLAMAAGDESAKGQAADPSADVLVVRRCPIDYEKSATMGSSQYGLIQECLVAPGDRVKAGQVIGRLRDDDLRAEVKLREMEASSDVEVRLSKARAAQATIKMRTTQALLRRNAASQEEFNLHKTEAEAANLAIEQAEQSLRLAKVRLSQAQSQLRAREFIAPYDGIVSAILKKKGEPVAPNEPVFKVVDVDHLQVTGQVDVTDSWRLRVGQSVRVIPEIGGADLPLEREVFNGRLVFIDTHVDPMSQTCKVLVQVENRGRLLRAGLEARIEIDPRAPVEEKPAAAAPAARSTPPAPGGPTAQLTRETR